MKTIKSTTIKALAFTMLCLAWQNSFAQYQVHIGDVLCTDSTTVKPSDYAASGKTAFGVVFWVDSTGEHGYAVQLVNASNGCHWSNSYYQNIPGLADCATPDAAIRDLNGEHNTLIMMQDGHTNVQSYAAYIATHVAGEGWYLPSAGQLNLLYSYMGEVESTLDILRIAGVTCSYMSASKYWSSTEYNEKYSWYIESHGSVSNDLYRKSSSYLPSIAVRAVRSF